MSDEQKYFLCSGENCPFKVNCARFKRDINKKTEDHYAWPPILVRDSDGQFTVKDKCNCYDPIDDNTNDAIEKIKEILSGSNPLRKSDNETII